MTDFLLVSAVFVLMSCGQKKKIDIPDNDHGSHSFAILQENEAFELSLEDKEENRTAVRSKYKALKEILNQELISSDYGAKGNSFRKIAIGTETAVVYHKNEILEAKKVEKDYGKLYLSFEDGYKVKTNTMNVSVKKGKDRKTKGFFQSSYSPPSGHWYPAKGPGFMASLKLLDQLALKRGRLTHIAAVENDFREHLLIGVESWNGFCHPWALGSARYAHFKLQPKEIDGIYFPVSVQKSFITYGMTRWPAKQYGTSNQGTYETDGMNQDLRPEHFHLIVQKNLGEQGRSIVVDVDSGTEAWFKPLYLYSFESIKSKKYPIHGVDFEARAYYREQRQEETEDETKKETENVVKVYKYRLYINLDEKTKTEYGYEVIAGRWITYETKRNHPDSIYVPSWDKDGLNSKNDEFNKNLDLVYEVLR